MATPGRHETVSLQQTIYFYYFPVPVSGMFGGLLLGAGVLVHFQSQHDVVGQGAAGSTKGVGPPLTRRPARGSGGVDKFSELCFSRTTSQSTMSVDAHKIPACG